MTPPAAAFSMSAAIPVSMARLIAGAADGKPFLGAGKSLRRRPSRPDRRRRMGFGGAEVPERHHRRSLLLDHGATGQYAAHHRLRRPDRSRGFLVRLRPQGRHRQDRAHQGRRARRPSKSRKTAGSIPSKSTPPATPSAPASRNSPIRASAGPNSIGNLRVLDQWRASIGLEYEVEKATRRTDEHRRRTVTKGNSVPKRTIPGIAKPASIVTLGFEFFPNFAAASLTLDAFYEAGGNAFDTAYVYGGGKTESDFRRLAHQPQGSA